MYRYICVYITRARVPPCPGPTRPGCHPAQVPLGRVPPSPVPIGLGPTRPGSHWSKSGSHWPGSHWPGPQCPGSHPARVPPGQGPTRPGSYWPGSRPGAQEYVYIYMYIEKATASAADLWGARLGCLDAWMLGCLSFCLPCSRFGTNLNHILEAFDQVWCLLQGPGAIWAPLE